MTSGNLIFLDRDGVINVDYGYVSRSSDFDFIPELQKGWDFSRSWYKLIVITNQSGIARGLYTSEDYFRLLNIIVLILGPMELSSMVFIIALTIPVILVRLDLRNVIAVSHSLA